MILVLFPTVTLAGWEAIAGGDDNVVYVDSSTLRKNGTKVKLWRMIDFRMAQSVSGAQFLSVVAQDEFDCQNELRRPIFGQAYSENMGAGTQVNKFNDPNSKWEPIPPGTAFAELWKYSCKKK